MNVTRGQTLTALSHMVPGKRSGVRQATHKIQNFHFYTNTLKSPQGCWWFFPMTTSARRRPASAAECWSGRLCSAPRASCPHGSSELGSLRRTRRRCPACGRRTGGWCGPRALRTTPARRRSHTLREENRQDSHSEKMHLFFSRLDLNYQAK